MNRKVGTGEHVYVVESNRIIQEATVLRNDGEFVLIRLKGMEGAIRLRSGRLFETEEDARKTLPAPRKEAKRQYHWHYAY